ncbi:MAG: tyrosine-type recombinase/integrase [Clostridiaceae bacterium]|nr:tyrosine-type recombinase/integrase [Clostridiaceae bacterium]
MMNEKRFKVVLAKLPTGEEESIYRWFITDGGIPLFDVNEWLDEKSFKCLNTGKTYANELVKFLNFLDLKDISYLYASNKDIKNYIKFLIYKNLYDVDVLSFKASVTYGTIRKNLSVITGFYKWLEDEVENLDVEFKRKVSQIGAKKSYYYGQIWSKDYSSIIDVYIKTLKPTKEYIKWYTDEEIEAILSNFNNLRDKAMFLCMLEGMRIDEVISIKLEDYSSDDKELKPSRSKSKWLRSIQLPEATCKVIDDYIFTERADAEIESHKIIEYLFINIKKGKYQGLSIGYRNYYGVLKKCAARAGISPEKIRTHSGRSTKTMDLLKHQVLYPEDNLSDAQILEIMGWKSIDSLEPYRNHENKIIAKTAAEKINKKRKRSNGDKTS